MFIKLWALYLAALQVQPLLTKCMTSAVGFILGDGIAQAIAKECFDGLRTLRFAIIGFTLHAPIAGLYLASHYSHCCRCLPFRLHEDLCSCRYLVYFSRAQRLPKDTNQVKRLHSLRSSNCALVQVQVARTLLVWLLVLCLGSVLLRIRGGEERSHVDHRHVHVQHDGSPEQDGSRSAHHGAHLSGGHPLTQGLLMCAVQLPSARYIALTDC